MRSFGTDHSLECTADTVGDRAVKGIWNDEAHRGVLGTVGKGYDGVRKGWWPAGVGGTLPRMVLADSVDSVDVVAAVGNGLGVLAKAPSSVGEMAEMGSSLMGDTLLVRPALTGLDVGAAMFFMRWRCCCCKIFSCRLRRRSTSNSSGDTLSCAAVSAGRRSSEPSPPGSRSSSLMSMSVSVAGSSLSSGRGPGERGSSAGDVRGRRCSSGRVLDGEVVVESLVIFSVASLQVPSRSQCAFDDVRRAGSRASERGYG